MQITVVIPLFNKAPHIMRAISSIRAQALQPHEIIVVDDGSTDGGLELVQSLDIPNLRLLQRSPPGAAGSAARNMGIEAATGDWIALLDADDEWLPTHLLDAKRAVARCSRRDDVVLVFSGYEKVFPDGRRERDPFTDTFQGEGPAELDFATLVAVWLRLRTSPIWTSATLLRRQSAIDAGLFPAERCSRGEDKDTWLRIAHRGLVLTTKSQSAIYHWDSVNMATKRPFANTVPCVSETIEELLQQRSPREQALLQRLANRELFAYGLATTKFERLRRDTWRGLYPGVTPWLRVGLELLSLPPVSAVLRLGAGLRRSGTKKPQDGRPYTPGQPQVVSREVDGEP